MADRVLVLGATGFLGRAVTHKLIDTGYQVRVVARDQAKAGPFRVRGAEVLIGDGLDEGTLASACAGVAAVVDCVAVRRNHPQTFLDVNIEHPLRLGRAAAAAGVHKVVFVSAVGAGPKAASTYLASRYAGEQALTRTGIPTTVLRFSFIVGDDGGLITDFERACSLGPVVVVPGDGQARYQPIVKDDAATCVLHAVSEDLYGHVLELGGTEILTYEQLLDMFMQARGIRKPKIHVPVPLLFPGAAVMELVMSNPIVVPDELRALGAGSVTGSLDAVNTYFGFQPQLVSRWAVERWSKRPGA